MSIQRTIIRGIKEQLFSNNYLVLPGFGGFVLKPVPSHFSSSGGLLAPPSKTVSFNAQLRQNDGILALWLQNTLKCHANEAMAHLNEFSEFCTSLLNAKRRLSLEGIGFFYLDFENNICFEPQPDANFLASSFGLGPVSVKELAPEQEEIKKETVFIDRTATQHQELPQQQQPVTRRNYRRLVTPLALAIVCVCLLGLLVNNVSMNGELRASLFSGDSKKNYKPLSYPELTLAGTPEKPLSYVADANGIASLELEASKRVAVKAVENGFTTPSLTRTRSTKKHYSPEGGFQIVFGCFAVLDNAERMVKKLSAHRIEARVTDKKHKGMYVVSNGGYASKEEAISQLQQIKDNYPNAWIKKDE